MNPTNTSELARTVRLGDVAIKWIHADPTSPYSLLEWTAPPGTQSPPVHLHHHTDEGFYVLRGTYGFLLDDTRSQATAGSHVLVPKGHPHTFWNAGAETATCLMLVSPPGFEDYFLELAKGLAAANSDEEAMQLRVRLSATYDIELAGPPVKPD